MITTVPVPVPPEITITLAFVVLGGTDSGAGLQSFFGSISGAGGFPGDCGLTSL